MPDLDALVLGPCMTAWGESVTFMPAAGTPQVIAGVWSERFKELSFEDGNPLSSTKPVLGCRESAFLQLPVQNDIFLIRGRQWAAEVIEPDGQGHLHIQLRLAADTQSGQPVLPATPPPPQ